MLAVACEHLCTENKSTSLAEVGYLAIKGEEHSDEPLIIVRLFLQKLKPHPHDSFIALRSLTKKQKHIF